MAYTQQDFDANAYLAARPDLAAAGYNADNAFEHWTNYGQFETNNAGANAFNVQGQYGNFDANKYLELRPDLIDQGYNVGNAYQHWTNYGQNEATNAGLAAWSNYVPPNTNQTQQTPTTTTDTTGTTTPVNLVNPQGYPDYNTIPQELMSEANFNPELYLQLRPSLAAAGYTPENAYQHWVNYGAAEAAAGTNPGLAAFNIPTTTDADGNPIVFQHSNPTYTVQNFDPYTYLQERPDLAAAGFNTPEAAWLHWNMYGQFEENNPGTAAFRINGMPADSVTALSEYMADSVQNPQLPVGTEFVPQTMSVQDGELVTAQQIGSPTIGQAGTVTNTPMTTAQADTTGVTVDPNAAASALNGAAGNYTATTTDQLGGSATMQAAQGTVSNLSTIVGQLTRLYNDTDNGAIAEWAQGAVRVANDAMAARGLANSSIGAGAITEAVQSSAIQIAAQDAATYFQMDLQNLANEQQANLVNAQAQQQSLLSDQAAINAAKQFNAASGQQIAQFQAQLIADIQTQNANRIATLKQFNAQEANKMTLATAQLEQSTAFFNEQQRIAVEQFNASTEFQRDQFNATMQTQIDQANAKWRQTINTANTANVNAANQLNVQNQFNLSTFALNSLWQSLRDEVQFSFTASQNAADRDAQLALAAAKYEYASRMTLDQANLEAQAAEGTGWGQILGSILTLWGD